MSQHPDTEQLLQFLMTPTDVALQSLATHLAGCADCRQRVSSLSSLSQHIKQGATFTSVAGATTNEVDFDMIAHYLDGRLDASQAQTIRKQIEAHPAAAKAALHYVTHSAAMRRAIPDSAPQTHYSTENVMTNVATHVTTTANETQSIASNHTVNRSLIKTVMDSLAQWLDWKPHAWISVPVTAVVVFSVTLFLLPQLHNQSSQQSAALIAHYQDDPVVTFSPENMQRPGIGFFSTAPSSRAEFAPVKLSLNDEVLEMSWPAVNNALHYQVQLLVYHGAEAQSLQTKTSTSPSVSFEQFTAEPGRRYEWIISGRTSDKQTFKANGGFVIQ